MELLGVGPAEIIFILLLALILIGPRDMAKTGRTIGSWLNRFVRSDTYKVIQKTGAEIREMPKTLMREANIEEYKKEMEGLGKEINQIGSSLSQPGLYGSSFDEKKTFDPGLLPSTGKTPEAPASSPAKDETRPS